MYSNIMHGGVMQCKGNIEHCLSCSGAVRLAYGSAEDKAVGGYADGRQWSGAGCISVECFTEVEVNV